MITVGTMVGKIFVNVNNEPWLCLGVDPRVGQLLVIEDPIGKIKIDPSFSIVRHHHKPLLITSCS